MGIHGESVTTCAHGRRGAGNTLDAMTAVVADVRLVRGAVPCESFRSFPPSCGAECGFVGRTRGESHAQFGALVRLEYEAYEPMVLGLFRELARSAAARFGLGAVRMIHALGPVGVGEASVLVQVAAPHRDAAFVACRELIDALKAEAPIWKREVWTAGTSWSPGAPVTRCDAAPQPGVPGAIRP
jgi:molybdopterin synthase catalytic subunit